MTWHDVQLVLVIFTAACLIVAAVLMGHAAWIMRQIGRDREHWAAEDRVYRAKMAKRIVDEHLRLERERQS